jgi:hypothetical protein
VLTPRHPDRTWPRSAFADAIWLGGPVCLSSLLGAGALPHTPTLITNYALTPPPICGTEPRHASGPAVFTHIAPAAEREARPTQVITHTPDKEPPIAATLPMKHFEVYLSSPSRAFGMCGSDC